MQTERRPFHETIVKAILYTSSLSQIECLAKLIKETDVPKNHDAIIAAFEKRMEELDRSDVNLGVCANLLEQKQFYEKHWKEQQAQSDYTIKQIKAYLEKTKK